MPRTVLLQAAVGPGEAAVVRRAAAMIEESLDHAIRVDVALLDCAQAMDRSAEPRLLVTSLLADAEPPDAPWAACEGAVRARHAALARDPGVTVYLCTLFRYVGPRAPGSDRALVRRIRQLDLLAAELSRETGLFVVDLDRALADVGGAALDTDWRLGGPAAAEAGAPCLAAVVLATGLEGVVGAAAVDAATQALARRLAASPVVPRPLAARPARVAVRAGAGRQTVKVLSAQGGAELYLRAALDGTLSLRGSLDALARAIARHGPARAAILSLTAVRALLARRRPQAVR